MSQWGGYARLITVEVEGSDTIMSLVGHEDLAEGPSNVKQDLPDLLRHNQEATSQWMENSNQSESRDWDNLPHVVLEKIFSNLNEVSLLKAQFVCKRWYDVIRHSAALWRNKTYRFSGRNPRDLTHGPYKYATNFTRTFGRYLRHVEFKLFSPVSSGVCKKFQKCVKVCLNFMIKNRTQLKSLSIPCLQLDRSQWMLYREDMCSSLARFFCKSQHTIERVSLRGARASFDDGYKVLYALGYNTGGTVSHLNISDMIMSRRPLFDCPQFVECFKNFKSLRELDLNYSYISEELLEILAENLQENSLQLLTTSVTQYDPHNQVIWDHSWAALAKRCRDLKVEMYFQRVMTYEQHFRILLPQIPLSEISFDGCYFADRDWQICPTLASILPRYKSTLERLIIELPDTHEVFENELLSLIMLSPNLWYVKMSAYISTRFIEKLLKAISERKCNVVVIKIRIYVRDYDTETEELDLERIYNKYRDLILTELHDYYATCCVSM